jgi:hypothetical protein
VFENINIADLVEDIQTIGASQIYVVFIHNSGFDDSLSDHTIVLKH